MNLSRSNRKWIFKFPFKYNGLRKWYKATAETPLTRKPRTRKLEQPSKCNPISRSYEHIKIPLLTLQPNFSIDSLPNIQYFRISITIKKKRFNKINEINR